MAGSSADSKGVRSPKPHKHCAAVTGLLVPFSLALPLPAPVPGATGWRLLGSQEQGLLILLSRLENHILVGDKGKV